VAGLAAAPEDDDFLILGTKGRSSKRCDKIGYPQTATGFI